jgi:hypothetical protein
MILRTSYLADGQPATTAFIMDESGAAHSLSYASAMRMLEESQPQIETPVEQLEEDVFGLLFILFQYKRQHPVILDGKDVGVKIGCKPSESYFHYINGHTLEVDEMTKECKYTSLTYVDNITPQETVWLKGNKVTQIAIHNFMNEPIPVKAEDRRFHGQLMHVRECLDQAVLRIIYNTPYDGETTVDTSKIAHGASAFVPTMYGVAHGGSMYKK